MQQVGFFGNKKKDLLRNGILCPLLGQVAFQQVAEWLHNNNKYNNNNKNNKTSVSGLAATAAAARDRSGHLNRIVLILEIKERFAGFSKNMAAVPHLNTTFLWLSSFLKEQVHVLVIIFFMSGLIFKCRVLFNWN